MLVHLECEGCGRTQSVSRRQAGQDLLCRHCGHETRVPGTPAGPTEIPDAQGVSEPCPHCRWLIPPGSVDCPACGECLVEAEPVAFTKQRPGKQRPGKQRPGKQQGGKRRPQISKANPHEARVNELSTQTLLLGIFGIALCQLLSPFALLRYRNAQEAAMIARVPLPSSATIGMLLGLVGTLILGLCCSLSAMSVFVN